MLTISNGLSFFRAPLALLFLQESPSLRILAILLAMITDSIDGYLARRNKQSSRLGAILDPAMDKFFVYFSMTILFLEGKMAVWEVTAMLSRDFFLCLYTLLMLATGRWKGIILRAIRWGKITTALQFITLMGIILNIAFPWYFFAAFFLMGWLAFLELFQISRSTTTA
ncbi:MAG: CDP-alcohol phosphatidyltransferase family protein [Chlamydiota bacterium]